MPKKENDEEKPREYSESPENKGVNKEEKKKEEEKKLDMEAVMAKLPKDSQQKLVEIRDKLEKFKKKLLEKFKDYIIGIALLPPEKPGKKDGEAPEEAVEEKDQKKLKINVLILIDDSDSKKMSKEELSNKLNTIIDSIAREIDENISPRVMLLSELWQSCYDGKYEILELIALSAPLYDTGMLSAIKITEVHKTMVIKKFEKYIVSYVLAGSLVKGKATKTSDIDVWIVVDDTDVKRMTRAELKDKLRAIIITMGIEAGEITEIKNKLNVQVYILTDFWESLKEANPIIFTLLRDGVPLYDRGIFMPWKQLLQMGRIKPSQEAIDMFMNAGEQMLQRVEYKLKEIGTEDIYYAILTPSQAALMLYGVPPPDPRETVEMMREMFVKKQKLLEEKYIDILQNVVKFRKETEHGVKKEVSGKEIDELLRNAEDYLKRIQRLFTQIQKIKEEEDIVHIYDSTLTVVRDVLKTEGIENVEDSDILERFNKTMICKGIIPAKFLRTLKELIKAKQDYDEKKLGKAEIQKIKSEFSEFVKYMVEYMQRKHVQELEKTRIKVKYGKEKFGEVIILENQAFIIHDIGEKSKRVSKAEIDKDNSFANLVESSTEELDETLAKARAPVKISVKEKLFENLKNIFGKDVEIIINI